MNTKKLTRQELVDAIAQLPDDALRELDNFIDYLHYKFSLSSSNNISEHPKQMIKFGMFSGINQSTEDDFKEAEFHGDDDDFLNWE
ncbi:MAG: DUF2281 domain-containing protein [Spirulina sp.]